MIGPWLRHLAARASDAVEKPLEAYVELETSDSETAFVSRGRALVTLLRVHGTRDIKSEADRARDVERLVADWKPSLMYPGHGIEFNYARDPEQGYPAAKEQLFGARAAANTIGLNMESHFDAQEKHLGKHACKETYHIALWTLPLVLPPVERKAAIANTRKEAMHWPGRQARDAQNPFLALAPMRNRHEGFVSSVASSLTGVEVEVETLETHEAGKDIYENLWVSESGAGFRLCLPGDPVPMMVPDGDDPSALLWPKIGRQLSVWNPGRLNWETARFGSRMVASIDVTIGPETPQDFGRLRDRLMRAKVPFRLSMRIRSGGARQMGWSAQLAPFAAAFGRLNRRMMKALLRLKNRDEDDGCVTWQLSLATWAPNGEHALLQSRLAELRRCVSQWGTMQVRSMCGDPMQGALSSVLGISLDSTAVTGYAPIGEMLTMMPHRAASPWQSGAVPLLTPDGAFFPYEEGTTVVDYSFTLVFARMRAGKSAWLARLALGNILATGADRLPFFVFLDVGFGSTGIIETLREALPPDRRGEVAHEKMRMDASHAINLLDTPLACRYAPPDLADMIVEPFSILATSPEAPAPPEGLGDLMPRLIHEAFHLMDDHNPQGQPKLYFNGTDPEVDTVIGRRGISVTNSAGGPTAWWRIVDRLAEAGEMDAAERANRQAVPVAADLLLALRQNAIQDDFKTYMVGEQTLLEVVENNLKNALVQFPICNGVTQFDPKARFIAVDLQDVLGKGDGPAAKKQTAVSYTWCMVGLTKRWWVEPRDVANDPLIPDQFRAWHLARAEDIASTPKILFGDEIHETSAAPSTRTAIKKMVRKGPKYRIRVTLATQILTDYDADMRKLASAFVVLSVDDETIAEMKTIFELGDAHCAALRKLGRRDQLGVPMFLLINTRRGRFAQLVYNTMSPRELWAVATNPKEVTLRRRLTARVGFSRAVALLSSYEPFQTRDAEAEIDTRIKRHLEHGEVTEAQETVVINELVDDMVAISRESMRQSMGELV